MSLEKFEPSENWRSNFKKFLFVERKPVVKKAVTIETHRYSLDVGKDLRDLINERKKQAESKNSNCSSQKTESREEIEENMNNSPSTRDDTFYGTSKQSVRNFEKMSDESFEALEMMCDKTASDPDSTLFQYLHSDNKEKILAGVKKRSTNEIDVDGNKVLLAKFGDCTMLDDVEAPSRLWENTIAVDSGFRTSPVKMVGLMRPSTILEEPGDESTNSDVSHSSYKTISTKGAQSDISSVYDTANETTVSSSRTDVSNQHCQFKEIDVEDMLMMAIEKSRNRTLTSQIKPRIETLEKSCTKTNTSSEGENDDVNASVNLIDLEKTLGSSEITKYTSESSNNATPDIVVIDDDQKEINELHDTVGDDDISVIDILSDEEDEHQEKSSVSRKSIKLEDNFDNYTLNDENKENYTFESSDPSIKFNDTMEEVEYLLKRGMEYMTAKENEVAEQSIQHTNDTNCASKVYRTQPNSPMLTTNPKIPPVNSESKVKFTTSSSSSIKSPSTNSQTTCNRFALDMRPFPKLDIFGKTQKNKVSHPRQKELSTNKQQFAHIVSPVGTYMKKTASTPLMSTGKLINKNANILNTTAFRELEYESRLCQPKIGINASDLGNYNDTGLVSLPGCIGVPNTLPKKAYISSELKHIVDERTPFTIPGGKKIQKYLENAMMPAVLRHDGKIKMPGGTMSTHSTKVLETNTVSTSMNSQRNNASLADLSVMSGDVSMYTIMDAQKF